jgi:branched-chain amino acid transport system ATP-binding protein
MTGAASMTEPHLLELQEVDAAYGPVRALKGVSLQVDAGEIVTLIGANGAGKSTLLMTIFGEPRAAKGRISFKGRDLGSVPTHEIARLGIALVPEGRRIFSGMTVEENLLMGTICIGTAHVEEDLVKVFEMFPRLQERFRQRAGTLSGGEQQMLAIARALMGRPTLLLLDEPSLGLAPLVVRQIFETLAEIAAAGTTVFLVEQNANHALRLAGRGYVLVNGEIRLSGSGAELLANPEVRKAYLGGH